ncbi:MAG TPA: hypothetical protein VMJ32_16570 [Pirellulales bacterium]|nr:hypothetical protein [Pirellulales bacterium]
MGRVLCGLLGEGSMKPTGKTPAAMTEVSKANADHRGVCISAVVKSRNSRFIIPLRRNWSGAAVGKAALKQIGHVDQWQRFVSATPHTAKLQHPSIGMTADDFCPRAGKTICLKRLGAECFSN